MRTEFSWALRCLVVFGLLGACSGGDGAKPVDAAAEASTTNRTCQDIRGCIGMCNDGDQACTQTCIGMGSPAAQAAFQVLASCTAPYCPTGAFACSCDEQCFADGRCLTETEACVGGGTDNVCDILCH